MGGSLKESSEALRSVSRPAARRGATIKWLPNGCQLLRPLQLR